MFSAKIKVMITALAAVITAALLCMSAGVAGDSAGAYKLEGAWIAKVPGTPAQWTYVVVPDPSGRRAVAHGSVQVGPSLEEAFGPYELSPLLVDIKMTGRKVAAYNSIWYGTRKLETPSEFGSEMVLIGVAKGTLTYEGPEKAVGLHNFEFYLPTQDANGDGLPDEGQAPVVEFQLTTVDTKLPSP